LYDGKREELSTTQAKETGPERLELGRHGNHYLSPSRARDPGSCSISKEIATRDESACLECDTDSDGNGGF